VIRLNCPSCNGALELPNNLGIANCLFCGTKIQLRQGDAATEQANLERFSELVEVALEAKNYDEAIMYCNKVLEIDHRNTQTWVNKANATFWLTTGAHNRYDEAMEYLYKAAQLAPDDIRIMSARDTLADLQAWWLNKLGNDTLQHAREIADLPAGTWDGAEQVRKSSQKLFVEAMNNYLEAASHAPDDEAILQNVASCATAGWWISWSDNVSNHARRLDLIRAKRNAEGAMPIRQLELDTARSTLRSLRMEKGLLVGFKIRDTEKHIQKLEAEIAKLRTATAFVPPARRY
jgi:tetratricopeptide (TPR) repeat protein